MDLVFTSVLQNLRSPRIISLKALDTFGDCQRSVFSIAIFHHIHKNNERKKQPWLQKFVVFQMPNKKCQYAASIHLNPPYHLFYLLLSDSACLVVNYSIVLSMRVTFLLSLRWWITSSKCAKEYATCTKNTSFISTSR